MTVARVSTLLRGRRTYAEDKPPGFILADRGNADRYVLPAKAANESTIRLLLADHKQEDVYTDGFLAYEPLAKTTHSTANTLSTARVNTLMEMCTSIPVMAVDHWYDRGSPH